MTKNYFIVHREMEIECIDGVDVELDHILPQGWTATEESGSFVVRGRQIENWRDKLWSVVSFLAYSHFLALRLTYKDENVVRYEMVSSRDDGQGFRVELILTRSDECI